MEIIHSIFGVMKRTSKSCHLIQILPPPTRLRSCRKSANWSISTHHRNIRSQIPDSPKPNKVLAESLQPSAITPMQMPPSGVYPKTRKTPTLNSMADNTDPYQQRCIRRKPGNHAESRQVILNFIEEAQRINGFHKSGKYEQSPQQKTAEVHPNFPDNMFLVNLQIQS